MSLKRICSSLCNLIALQIIFGSLIWVLGFVFLFENPCLGRKESVNIMDGRMFNEHDVFGLHLLVKLIAEIRFFGSWLRAICVSFRYWIQRWGYFCFLSSFFFFLKSELFFPFKLSLAATKRESKEKVLQKEKANGVREWPKPLFFFYPSFDFLSSTYSSASISSFSSASRCSLGLLFVTVDQTTSSLFLCESSVTASWGCDAETGKKAGARCWLKKVEDIWYLLHEGVTGIIANLKTHTDPCSNRSGLKHGIWTPGEDGKLIAYVANTSKVWRAPWTLVDELIQDIKRGNCTPQEDTNIRLHTPPQTFCLESFVYFTTVQFSSPNVSWSGVGFIISTEQTCVRIVLAFFRIIRRMQGEKGRDRGN
ncbi:uncharacterized protein LOC129313241 [Prosopis cineraria]|uniref:uncharacterized protein LOC129313241 n=1 Tax=Prosopis cineraria TaxID=364024 RepID=UPI00240F7283|nr:uncharacterized protein LOC129313241 [Prosopis cineraria]